MSDQRASERQAIERLRVQQQARDLLQQFESANGRPPESDEELGRWVVLVAEGR